MQDTETDDEADCPENEQDDHRQGAEDAEEAFPPGAGWQAQRKGTPCGPDGREVKAGQSHAPMDAAREKHHLERVLENDQ